MGLQLIGLDGSVVRQLPDTLSAGEAPALSPDGRTVAYYTDTDSIRSIRTDGTGDRELVASTGLEEGDAKKAISWSPDGSRIAYEFDQNVWIMNADGSDRHALTVSRPGVGNYHPAWSPDGSTIAYLHGSIDSPDGGPADAEYTIPVDGGAATRLTHDDVASIEPSWSPDGRSIVYRRSWPDDLVVMRADGSHARVVTPNWTNPCWARHGRPTASRSRSSTAAPITAPRTTAPCSRSICSISRAAGSSGWARTSKRISTVRRGSPATPPASTWGRTSACSS
jgi:Tol biopolymer transport system component